MDELMEFLASYVRVVHADRYYKNLLIKNRGSSYLDIITASDIAYVVSLIKNSDDVWLKRKTADGELVKSLYMLVPKRANRPSANRTVLFADGYLSANGPLPIYARC